MTDLIQAGVLAIVLIVFGAAIMGTGIFASIGAWFVGVGMLLIALIVLVVAVLVMKAVSH